MGDDKRRAVLELIVAQIARLRILAAASVSPAVGSWLEGALAEVRAELARKPGRAAAPDLIPIGAPRMQAAKSHLAEAERRVARQRQVIEQLSKDGHSTTMAE